MLRHVLIVCLPAMAVGPLLAGRPADLEAKLLDHLNDRMYGACRAVVLTSDSGNVYEGYVRFHNGRRSDLRVTVSAEEIEYTLGQPAANEQDGQPPKRQRLQQAKDRLKELQALLAQQRREIARLEGLGGRTQPAADPNAATPSPWLKQADRFAADRLVTREMYEKIEKDMSVDRVTGILGSTGMLLSTSRFDGALNEVYVWTNPDDSHICVVFRDDGVLVKTQFGLGEPAR